jgi:NAD(P)-dependent dehydrogenase (short-subunit alcohol dehydrogenase family)
VLITGANRGIGLAHAIRYADRGWKVLACARGPVTSGPLAELAARHGSDRVRLLDLDVTREDQVEQLVRDLRGTPLDVLVNNAGTFGPAGSPEGMAYQSLARMDYDIWRRILEVNLLAPFRLTVALLPNLRAAPRPLVVMMSSDLGSIANNRQGQSYAYRSSKAGLNMVARGMAMELKDVIVVAMAPGWCRTDLGGAEAELDPAESVAAQQATFDRLSLTDSGRFLDRHGADVPW